MASSTDKWAKGKAVAAFRAAVQNTKEKTASQGGGKTRTDNSQGAGKGTGQTIARGDEFSANTGNDAAMKGAEARGQTIHHQTVKGPRLER